VRTKFFIALGFFLGVLVGGGFWYYKNQAWHSYTSADKKLTFSYPPSVFKFASIPTNLFNSAAYAQYWTNKKVDSVTTLANGYGPMGTDFLELSIIYVSQDDDKGDTTKYTSAKPGEIIETMAHQTNYKVQNLQIDKYPGYIYLSKYNPDLSTYTLTADWPSSNGLGKYEMALLGSSEETLTKNQPLFLQILKSVRISK
jgi:hypothetical protein